MNCHQTQQHLYADSVRALPQVELAAFKAHLDACPSCRRIHEDLLSAVEGWRQETNSVRVPDADLEWQKVRRRMHTSPASSHRSVFAWIATPIAAAAAVALGLYLAPGSRGPATPTTSVAVNTAPAAPADVPSTVIYVDDKSGWTFVWGAENGANSRHI